MHADLKVPMASTLFSELAGHQRDPAKAKAAFEKAFGKSWQAALDAGDLKTLGACLDENHALCQQLLVLSLVRFHPDVRQLRLVVAHSLRYE